VADLADIATGVKRPYESAKESFLESAKDVVSGTAFEVGGAVAPKMLGMAGRQAGRLVKPALGRLSGVGTGAVEEAMRGSKAFNQALRGKLSGEDVVANAKSALNKLIDVRGAKYRQRLAQISEMSDPIDVKPIANKLSDLMGKYNITIGPTGKIDTSRIAMGKKGRKDIQEIIDVVGSWGKRQGDATPVGLDTLKRQLDDFYSESSQARQFVTSLKNKVKEVISESVPEYKIMLKDYSEATGLIKDIEAGLMLRKQGMSGRIVADQTLRRLMSSMKDNFKLRKELVEVLGNKAGVDLGGQIAGYTMKSPIPVGLAGTGPLLVGQAAYATVNPKFWPVLAASSPRVQAEFLNVFGRFVRGAAAKDALMMKESIKQSLIGIRRENKEN
jgi:hypothetical protein